MTLLFVCLASLVFQTMRKILPKKKKRQTHKKIKCECKGSRESVIRYEMTDVYYVKISDFSLFQGP